MNFIDKALERRKEIKTMIKAGKIPAEIAKELRCSRQTVYNHLSKAGIALPPRHKASKQPQIKTRLRRQLIEKYDNELTVREVCRTVSVSRELVWWWCRNDKVKCRKSKGRWLIDKDSLDEYIENEIRDWYSKDDDVTKQCAKIRELELRGMNHKQISKYLNIPLSTVQRRVADFYLTDRGKEYVQANQ